jgi:ribosomal protein S27E
MSNSPKESIFEGIFCTVCKNTNHNAFKILYEKPTFSVTTCNQCGHVFIPHYFRKKITYTQYKNSEVITGLKYKDINLDLNLFKNLLEEVNSLI